MIQLGIVMEASWMTARRSKRERNRLERAVTLERQFVAKMDLRHDFHSQLEAMTKRTFPLFSEPLEFMPGT